MALKSPQSLQNRIPHLHRTNFRRPSTVNIRRPQPLCQDGFNGGFDAISSRSLVQREAQHHRRTQNRGQRVGDAFAGDVWGAAVAGLLQALFFVVQAG